MIVRHHHVLTVIRKIERLTADISRFELSDPDGWELPPYTPGAHVDVHVDEHVLRQYSLCSDPQDRHRYAIAVKCEEQGRGGSQRLHATFRVGREVCLSLPRNHFPLPPTDEPLLLVAGGIGITPFLSMIGELERTRRPFALHYFCRNRMEAAFHDALEAGGRTHFHFSQGHGGPRRNLVDLLGAQGWRHAHVLCCGPKSLVEDVGQAAAILGLSFQFERFGGIRHIDNDDPGYVVRLARSDRDIAVPAGQSMLSALREAGIAIDASCEAGSCMRCKTRYLAGSVNHRDLVMSASERAQFLTPCVSTCLSNEITLDL
ncbi:2Fe-2S iron-sulfur cluster-binding protein [Rhizobium ruizarguesonis]